MKVGVVSSLVPRSLVPRNGQLGKWHLLPESSFTECRVGSPTLRVGNEGWGNRPLLEETPETGRKDEASGRTRIGFSRFISRGGRTDWEVKWGRAWEFE